MAPEKIIIDSDPGVDDVLALSLAFNNPEKLEVLLITLSHGNVGVELCLKNLVALFSVLENEREFRRQNELKEVDFGKPVVALGANKPMLKEHAHGEVDFIEEWEGFHGVDGLNGVHSRLPDLIQTDYRPAFDPVTTSLSNGASAFSNFTPSASPAHVEILNQLRTNDPKTITIVAIGPCTNLAMAALEDPETFARAKRVVIMGGAVRVSGNQTPRAEFNIYADPDAAAVLFNLTQKARAATLRGQMDVALVPLDVTSNHTLTRNTWREFSMDLISKGSPLALFLDSVLGKTFEKMVALTGTAIFGCHDPFTIYALLESKTVEWETGLDIRVETNGIWTRGETVFDTRGVVELTPGQKTIIRDNGGWFSGDLKNSISILKDSKADGDAFGHKLLEGIFL
ncbi:related to inosine-uridine preferring nucleoside hydrolase [Phialocephala subalpina]|uniref:Related to inosine-uridine preferring nucleoside hydrolase n=1 Tax=Phialocephala subalpina TaxID=576137 RepID=A0A1L7WRZ0_9HELO|nr:related to inosine-uridine preferring nucleoside hydrolase [Phialocephala subalpina]